jgi:enoyl-CoA hydratase/carnithine racemase
VSIARVHGDAAGFGVGLAALCDFAIATPEAKFSFPEVEIGLAPVLVLAWLPQLVGRRQAMRLTATGASVDAGEAVALGLVTQVAEAAELDAQITELADGLRKRSPRVLAEIRDFLRVTDQATETQATELARSRLVVGSLRRGRD